MKGLECLKSIIWSYKMLKTLNIIAWRRQLDLKFLETTCIAVGSLKMWKSAYDIGLASTANVVSRCFVSVASFDYVDEFI
jgi:hypothetical protein